MFKQLKYFILFLFLFTSFSTFSAEVFLNAKLTSYANLVPNKDTLKKYLFAIASTDRSLPVSLPMALTAAEKAAVEKGCYFQGRLLLLEKCTLGLSPENTQFIVNYLAEKHDRFAPSYTLTFEPKVNAQLNQQPYVQYIHGSIQFLQPTDAKAILPKPVADVLWTSTLERYQANCLGTSIAAVERNMAPSFIWPPEDNVRQYFQKINENEPLQIGDVFAFIIPQDGHFFTYIGTDEVTGEKMVLSKNGSSPGPFQFMRYQDVYKIYQRYLTGTARYRSFHLNRDQLLPITEDIKTLSFSNQAPKLNNLFQKYLIENKH